MSLAGVFICAVSVGIFKIAAFGVDPFQSLMAGLDNLIPIPFGTLYVLVNLVLLVFSLVADRRNIGIATFINLFLLGYITQFTYELLQGWLPDPSILVRSLCLLAGIVIGVCVLMVLVHIFRICTAVKRHSAFSEITERALGRIVRALLVTSVLLIPLGWPLMGWLTLGLPELFWLVAALLPAFAGFTLTAMVRVVQLLLRRAVSMQTEADLTV